MARIARRAVIVLIAVVVLVLAACGGGSPGAAPTSSTSAPTPTATLRHGQIQVVHLLQDGQRRLTLQAVLDSGEVVMTAIGSDAEDAVDAQVPQWTTMRQALLVQLRAALETLGWTETGTGPAWYQVAFSGGPDARVAVIESPTAPTTSSDTTTEEPSPSTTKGNGGGGGTEVNDLLALIGRQFEDPAVYALVRRCGPGDDEIRNGNVACLGEGFELTLDSHLVVKAVTLFNLEYSGYSQYGGTLPLGLTWDDDYHAVLRKLGPPLERLGGGGVEVQLRYRSRGVYVLVTTTATHDNVDYLKDAKIHWIELSVDPAQGLPPD